MGIAGDKGEPGLTGEDGAKGTMGLHVHLYMHVEKHMLKFWSCLFNKHERQPTTWFHLISLR